MPGVPLAMNHVGITVPDVFAAIDWYSEVFGMTVLLPPRLLEPASHAEAGSALGPRFRKAWQGHLLTGNGTGIEVFQFLDPESDAADAGVPFTRRGGWHVCLTHSDPAAVIARAVANGGAALTAPVSFVPGRPWQLAYLTDPWGVVWEVMSASYAEVFGNWPQPGQIDVPVLVSRPTPTREGTSE